MISQQSHAATFTLSVTDSAGYTQQVLLQPDQSIFVGTTANCGLRLSGNGLSDIHCRIALASGELIIQDWMSQSGTKVNGETISTNEQLGDGDVIGVGEYHIEVTIKVDSAQPKAAHPVRATQPVPETQPVTSGEKVQTESSIDAHEELEPQGEAVEEPFAVQLPPVSEPDTSSFDIPDDFFVFEEEDTYDRETVALLHAEIEELQAALVQRDAELESRHSPNISNETPESDLDQTGRMLERIQELIDEANSSDERAAVLEEMLLAAETANGAEDEERSHLEGWVSDIEHRLSQREDEHAAEVDSLRRRLKESDTTQEHLHRKLKEAAFRGGAPKQYEETLESLQASNRQLQNELAESQRKSLGMEQKLSEMSEQQERELREERVNLAKEKAKLSRMRFELSSKLTDVEALPKSENPIETETSNRIQALRAHLREIHEQEKLEEKDTPLTKRLAKLWRRVEY